MSFLHNRIGDHFLCSVEPVPPVLCRDSRSAVCGFFKRGTRSSGARVSPETPGRKVADFSVGSDTLHSPLLFKSVSASGSVAGRVVVIPSPFFSFFSLATPPPPSPPVRNVCCFGPPTPRLFLERDAFPFSPPPPPPQQNNPPMRLTLTCSVLYLFVPLWDLIFLFGFFFSGRFGSSWPFPCSGFFFSGQGQSSVVPPFSPCRGWPKFPSSSLFF